MARYRKIVQGFWRDEKVRALSDLGDKAVGVYVLTAQSNRIGCFLFSQALAAEDLGIPPATFTKRFANVVRTLKWEYDDASRVLYIPSWWKTNHPENPNNMIGNLSDLDELPFSPLVARFCANIAYLKPNVAKAFAETLGKRYPEGMPTLDLDLEQEQELEREPAAPSAPTRPRGWRKRPSDEQLTPERRAMATSIRLAPDRVQREWDAMGDHEYARPRSDVDMAWRNWVRKAVDHAPANGRVSAAAATPLKLIAGDDRTSR